jgi:hypothetical protein
MTAKQKAIDQLLELRAQRKVVEKMIEQQLIRICTLMKAGETVELDDTLYELKDNFAETNIVFRPAAVFRFDVAEVKADVKRKT